MATNADIYDLLREVSNDVAVLKNQMSGNGTPGIVERLGSLETTEIKEHAITGALLAIFTGMLGITQILIPLCKAIINFYEQNVTS